MCKAIDEMVNTGRKEGRNQLLAKLYTENVISLEKACAEAKMTKEEFLKYCKNKLK